ncbi:MAG: mechanosensitive ion channel family protein [Tateyamaria sp.]|uniref:mechanosensitive ion channel family protein n=1 Tax=Tateyamaria sp. TaxID=1929288 RepID=UPI0032807AC6
MKFLSLVLALVMFVTIPLSSVAANEDLSRLSDEQVRELLLGMLEEPEAEPEPAFNPAETAYRIQQKFTKIHARASEILGAYRELPSLPGAWWDKMTNGRDGRSFGIFVLTFLFCVGVGLVASTFTRRRLNQIAAQDTQATSHAQKFGGRIVRHLISVLVLVVTATVCFFVFYASDPRDRTLFFFYLAAVTIIHFVTGASRAMFEPRDGALRIPNMTDRDAGGFHRSILTATAFGAFGFFSCASFAAIGINGDVHDLLLLIVGLVTTLLLTYAVWRHADAISNDILTGTPNPSLLRMQIARFWPMITCFAIPAMFFGLSMSVFLGGLPLYGAALISVAIMILLPIGEAALSRAVTRLNGTNQISMSIVARISRIVLLFLVIVILATSWRVNLLATGDDGLSSQVFKALTNITAMIAVAYAVWQVIRVFVDQKIAEEDALYKEQAGLGDNEEVEEIGLGMSRMRTLLPLLRRAAMIILFTLVTLVSLSSLGVNTGPLLAGAGVVGLAVGFGSQALVKDVVSGFFFLLEDAFRLGEYIDIGKAKGSVEAISVRSLKLRHHRGALNTVPFGSIDVIENFSRDWAIMKLKVRVPFETDLNLVRKLLKKAGQELSEVDAIKDDFLQPFKAQGAVEVDDYGFVISTKFMSKPGKQFVIRRYAFQAMQDAFEENGIPFSRPRVRVVIDGDNDQSDPARAAAGGAALTTSTP